MALRGHTEPALRSSLILLTAIFVCPSRPVSAVQAPDRLLLVCFRYDDPSAITPTELERQIIDIFRKFGAGHTFGVVPEKCGGDERSPNGKEPDLPLPDSKAAMFRDAVREANLEVALHGFHHRTVRVPLWPPTEFEGVPYQEQLARIRKGKTFLEERIGATVTTFIPPWNTYDGNTVRALEELGFSVLSASVEGTIANSKVRFLPSNCALGDLRSAVASFRRSSARRGVLVVIYHPYNFVESGEPRGWCRIKDLATLVAWCSEQPEIKLCSISQAGRICAERSASDGPFANARLDVTGNVAVDKIFAPGTFLSLDEPGTKRLLASRKLLLAVWYPGLLALPAIAGFVVIWTASRWRAWLGAALVWLTVALFFGILGYGTRHGTMKEKAAPVILACGALAVGAWLATNRRAAHRMSHAQTETEDDA